MLIAIVHNAVTPDSRADERDVLVQVEVVRNAILELGHRCEIIPVDLNLQSVADRLQSLDPEVVFNLAESLVGSDRMASLTAAVIEELGFPLTGSSSMTLWLSNHKTLAKERLRLLGLPTPSWFDPACPMLRSEGSPFPLRISPGDRFILKPVGEHSSLGMDESALIQPGDWAELVAGTNRQSEKLGCPCFAEQFIAGREFNVSLLADGDSCQVLPIAEIDFSAFPAGKARIVDYRAKWEADSFEFQHTPRRFLAPGEEGTLTLQLSTLSRECWSALQLRGHVRVDFRVDEGGQPWILEINTNPCLSPDAGFAAALAQAEIHFPQAIERILANALAGHPTHLPKSPPKSLQLDSRGDSEQDLAKDKTVAARQDATPDIQWRYEPTENDARVIRELVAETGFFYPDEVAIAEELVVERLSKGPASGYHFVLAEISGQIAGYASYGHIACTRASYDLYWIAVHPRFQGQGVGRLILEESERCIRAAGGQRVYIETSNREQYQSTRGFYLRCGYMCEATLAEFYGPGDDKVIYVKGLT